MWYSLEITSSRDEIAKALRKPIIMTRNNKVRATMFILTTLLNYFSRVHPNYALNSEEYTTVIKDTEASLHYYFDVNRHVNIDRKSGNDYIVRLIITSIMHISILITCERNLCDFYGDENIYKTSSILNIYNGIVNRTLDILCNIYDVSRPRIIFTPNPTVYGKVLFINDNEELALSLWELIRVSRLLEGRDLSSLDTEGLTHVLDTLIHEFIHYVIDLKYPVRELFLQLTKRTPAVIDDGIIHELVAECATPIISRALAEYVINGKAITKPIIESLKCHVPARRRHVVIARKIIDDLIQQLNKISR